MAVKPPEVVQKNAKVSKRTPHIPTESAYTQFYCNILPLATTERRWWKLRHLIQICFRPSHLSTGARLITARCPQTSAGCKLNLVGRAKVDVFTGVHPPDTPGEMLNR
ncbi:hypothetical protein BaRGS_00017284 [Batillaria attramentaria]|uniref:Uncharacterized protein n=1 Tax=Batillaria attramentaria TaxID=370345 RepID=A0ABD0KXC9_9CAEN